MDHDQVTRQDFPASGDGYDRASVDAHLVAVAAQLNALEARIASYEVERDALRRQTLADAGPAEVEVLSEVVSPEPEPPVSASARPLSPGTPKAQAPGSAPGDEVSARLIATKMALDDSDREAIRQRLTDTYDLEDVDSLLDDVLERIG